MKTEVPANQELIPVQQIDVPTLFTNQKAVSELLSAIGEKAKEHTPDLSTPTTRKEIASNAHKVAQSKTFLDGLGKQFVAERKAEIKISDTLRKKVRDTLDGLKAEVRKPLTEWEEAEKERKEREETEKKYAQDWDDAHAEHDLFLRQKEVERKEADIAKQEAERKAKEEADRLEKERVEREERIAKEAAERAQKEAEEAAQAEKTRLEKEKADAEQREKDAIAAAERAEQDRILAAKQAEIDKEEAKKEAIVETMRLAQQKADREAAEAERKAANRNHQKRINREALACFTDNGFDEVAGKTIIELVATNQIKHMKIEY